MHIARLRLLSLAVAALLGSRTVADEIDRVRFAAPERIRAGDAFAGEGRLYPSPVLHDVDGDGRLDLVVGDLRGMVTVALRTSSKAPVTFGAEKPLEDRGGRPLKFHNW